MSYPTGGSGYNAPATPPAPAGPGQSAGTGAASTAKGLPYLLVVGVAALGVINFLLGFLPFFGQKPRDLGRGVTVEGNDTLSLFQYFGAAGLLAILLLGGLLAGLSLLPKQNWIGAAAAASAAGFLGTLFLSFTTPDDLNVELKWGAYVLLALAFAQTAIAVVAVLFEAGILTPPAPKPATPQGPPGGFGGGYGQPGAFGQGQPAVFGQGQPSQYGQGQPGQYGQSQPGQFGQGAPQYQSQQPYGQSQPSQPTYGQQPPSYGQQPPSYGQQPGYGAAQQGSPYGAAPAAQPRPDESATQHFGAPQYGAPGFGQGQQGQQNQPFGGETGSDPSSDATHAFRPSDENNK
ncbi:DUF5336 domain-containing protein [Nocardia sp. R16R-3T]